VTPVTPDWAKIDLVGLAIPAFILLIILELILTRVRKQHAYEIKDTFTSLVLAVGSPIAGILTGSLGLAAALAVYDLRLFDIGWTWSALVLCFFAVDLHYYWMHRLCHERRLWWASHVVHHSSQHFNLSTALRQDWTGAFSLIFLSKLPLVFIGFPPAMMFFFVGVTAVYQFWIHTEHVGKLGVLDKIFNTPSNHRVHHATNPRYLDCNHGGFLIIWDHIFGTYVAERDDDPCRFGIVSNLGSFHPLRAAFHEWVAMGHDLSRARSLREVYGYIWGPPGWTPDGSRDTSRSIKEKWAQSRAVEVPAE